MISIVARYMAKQCARNRSEISTRFKSIPCFGDGLATTAMAETIPVDGGGDQRREATADEKDDPETQGGRAC